MPRVRHNVLMVSQQFSPVCWLACATMIMQYKRNMTPDASQLGITRDDFREPGYTIESETANNEETYAYLRRLSFTVTNSERVQRSVPSPGAIVPDRPTMAPPPLRDTRLAMSPGERLIHWLLVNKGPFILNHHCGAFSYGPGGTPRSGAHAVVITGLDTTPPRSRVYFNNPWGTKDVTTTTTSIAAAWQRWERAGGLSFAYLD